MQSCKTPIKIIRMKNAGENLTIQQECISIWNIIVQKTSTTHVSKMKSCETVMMYVGYTFNHPCGAYAYYNPHMNDIVTSSFVTWINFSMWEVNSAYLTASKLLLSSISPSRHCQSFE